MRRSTTAFVAGTLLLIAACTKTVVVQQAPRPAPRYRGSRPPPNSPPEPPTAPPDRPADRPSPPPSNPPTPPPAPPTPPRAVVRLMIAPAYLPDLGECRVWFPAMPPGLQPAPRSRPCDGIEAIAAPGKWIVYRPSEDRRLVHVRILDERRRGIVTRIRIFDINTQELVREEEPREERPPLPPREIIPPVQPPPDSTPRERRPPPRDTTPARPPRDSTPFRPPRDTTPREQRPPENKPPEPPPGPGGAVTLDIPPGHLPELGQCRVWIPGLPPGRQPRPKSRACDGIVSVAPAASWIIDRPRATPKLVFVRVVDERRAGVLVRIRVFDIDSKRLVREENP
jgi:hypothetical protein